MTKLVNLTPGSGVKADRLKHVRNYFKSIYFSIEKRWQQFYKLER